MHTHQHGAGDVWSYVSSEAYAGTASSAEAGQCLGHRVLAQLQLTATYTAAVHLHRSGTTCYPQLDPVNKNAAIKPCGSLLLAALCT